MCTGKAFPLSGKHRVPTPASNPFKVQKWQVICLATEKRIHVLPELHTIRSMFSQRHLYLLIKCQGWEDEDREIQSEKSNSENTYTALSVGIPSHLKYHCPRHTEFACCFIKIHWNKEKKMHVKRPIRWRRQMKSMNVIGAKDFSLDLN